MTVIPLTNATLIYRIHQIYNLSKLSDQHDGINKLVDDIKAHGVNGDYSRCVLQPWVMDLPLREQGGLLTAVRGCDLTPKRPLDSPERRIVSLIRGAFMVPADPRETDREPGTFMSLKMFKKGEFKPSSLGHYPLHWVTHVMHACETIGYRHPDYETQQQWQRIYMLFCDSLHVPYEQFDDYVRRMSEDRIAAGTVVQ